MAPCQMSGVQTKGVGVAQGPHAQGSVSNAICQNIGCWYDTGSGCSWLRVKFHVSTHVFWIWHQAWELMGLVRVKCHMSHQKVWT